MMGFPYIDWAPKSPWRKRRAPKTDVADARRYPMLAGQHRCSTGFTARPAPKPQPLWSGPREPPRAEDVWG